MAPQKYEELMTFDISDCRETEVHRHRDIELLYVLDGHMTLSVGHSSFDMQKDDIVVINSMEQHHYRVGDHTLAGVVRMDYFGLLNYLDMNAHEFRCNSVIDKNKGYQEMKKTLEKIFRLYFDREKEKVYLNSLYFELLREMMENFLCRIENQQENIPDDEKRKQEIIRYINTYYRYPISLDDVAQQLHLTKPYASKYIKKILGSNFVDYLCHVRLDNAVDELKRSDQSITRIALDNGFPNTAAFSNAFRNVYGCLPTVWQKNNTKAKAEGEKTGDAARREKSIQKFLEKLSSYTDEQEVDRAVLVSCDAEKYTHCPKRWNRLVNIGAVSSLLHSDLQKHILILHKELGVSYIRFWDIFSEDMLMDFEKADGNLNFKRIDIVLDFLINNGMHPFVELGLKPVKLLTRSVDRNVMMQERSVDGLQTQAYTDALRAFLVHCVNRYGMDEVEHWYFEQWCDPRLTQGTAYGSYFDIFEQNFHVIKSISPGIRMGGAGFGRLYNTLEFQDIVNLWKKRVCVPDFISMYAYPYMARSGGGMQNNDRIQDPDFIKNQVMMMREVLERAGMQVPELMLTEWSSSVSDWNSFNDSMYKGAFMLKSIIDNIGQVDMMGYWLASDILTEYFDTGKILHGGNGLISTDGIRKPAFYAMQFAGKIYENILTRTEQAVVTANGYGNYYIACHNHVKPNFKYYLKQEDEIDVRRQFLLFDDANALKLHFRIAQVRNGKYMIKTHALSEKSGSVQDVWADMNYSENLSQRDIDYLKGVSTPKISIRECEVRKGVLEFDTILAPQEIQNIHILFRME